MITSEVEGPRMRDEVLPEHEAQFPADDIVRAMIEERYDGTASTNHEIGNDLYSHVAGAVYPGWRIDQIARQLGLADERLRSLVRGAFGPDAEQGQGGRPKMSSLYMGSSKPGRNGRTRNEPRREVNSIDDAIALVKAQRADGGGRDDETLAIEQEALESIKADRAGQPAEPTDNRPVCRECGRRFEPWRKYRGKLATGATICRACLAAVMRARPAEAAGGAPRKTSKARDAAETATPAPLPAPAPEERPQLRIPAGDFNAPADPTPYTHLFTPERAPEPPRPQQDARQPADALLSIVRRAVPLDRPLTFLERPGNDDAMIFGLLDHLPANARWTSARRQHWIQALVATLDLLIEVTDGDTATANENKEAH